MNRSAVFGKFFKNLWAVASSLYISLLFLIAIFAYQIAPDSTSNANQMHLSIHSKPPGFTTKMVVLDNGNKSDRQRPFFSGDTNDLTEIPIQDYVFEEGKVKIQPYGSPGDYFETLGDQSVSIVNFESDYLVEKTFPLGTDKYGRDLLSRLIIGTRISLSIGFKL